MKVVTFDSCCKDCALYDISTKQRLKTIFLGLLPEFYETAFELFEYLLSYKYLKKFQGRHVTCSELFDRVESYCLHNTFSGGEESAIMVNLNVIHA